MKFPWHSDRAVLRHGYESEAVVESKVVPGVKFSVAKMSFGRRVELMRRVRELAGRYEFLAASENAAEKMDAALLQSEIQRTYVLWGVKAISGLTVNGRSADVELMAAEGPEALFLEVLAAVRREAGLTEEERKNS